MPAKKRTASRSGWSAGRAPAWVRERSKPAQRKAAPAKRSTSPAKRTAAKRASSARTTVTRAAAKRTGAGRTTAKRGVAKRAPAKRTPAKRTPARRATARRASASRKPASRALEPARTEDAIQRELLDFPMDLEAAQAEPLVAQPLAAQGGIAIAGVTPSTLEAEETPSVAEPLEPPVERRPEDPLLALLAVVLAGSVFLPWYKVPQGLRGSTATGWQTGTWGPVIFFLGVGALAIVALRRLRIPVGLPFPDSIVLEAIGWVATLTAIIKARFRPDYASGFKFGLDNRIWVAVGAGLALALLAGRASGKTPFVSVPGWYRGKAGKIGLALLVLVIGAGGAFAFTNSYKGTETSQGNGGTRAIPSQPGFVQGKLPDCAKGFPLPAGLKPYSGSGSSGAATCVALLTSDQKLADVVAAFKAALTAGGYKFTQPTGTAQATVLKLTSPRCGQLQVASVQQASRVSGLGNTIASLFLTPCTS